MGLMNDINLHVRRITTDEAEFAESAVFVAPTGETVTCGVIHTKHSVGFNEEGERITSGIASIAVSESVLTDEGYPTRNADALIHFEDHKVSVADSTGVVKEYVCSQWFPDEAVGLIVLILARYEA